MENKFNASIDLSVTLHLSDAEFLAFTKLINRNEGNVENAVKEIFNTFFKGDAEKKALEARIAQKPVSPSAVLSWNQVGEIRKMYNDYTKNVAQLAKRFNVSTSTISNIISNNTWYDSSYHRYRY